MNDILVKITGLDHFGRGISKIDGKIIFIPNTYIDEEVFIRITKNKKKFLEGEVISFKKKSPFRIEEKCKIKKCGCALKHIDYNEEIIFKKNKVKNILERYSNLNNINFNIIPSVNEYNYRNKVTLKVNDKLGYSENGSHNFICIERCELLNEKINEVIYIINKLDLSNVKEVMIRNLKETMVCFKGNVNYEPLKGIVSSIYINGKLVYGKPKVLACLNNYNFLVSNEAFFQVNTKMAEKLYQLIADVITKDKNKTLLDLYCGTGTIGIYLSKYFKNVIGIEIVEKAVEDARENAEINNINNCVFKCFNLDNGVDVKADIIIVDPPRKGLGAKTINDIIKINPQEIVYVSCDPMTLARDIKLLSKNYEISKIVSLDMFPRTYHVESVCVLERR